MYILITTTVPNYEVAKGIANCLLTRGLAACVQFQDIESHYIWDGEIQHNPEVLLYIKTRAELYNTAEECIAKNHPYDVPQIIALPITAGFTPYLQWIGSCTH